MLVGLAVLAFGLVAAPEWAGSSHPGGRGAAAIPVALAVWLIGSAMQLGNTITLFLAVAAAVAVLIPPTNVLWCGGLGVGLLIASSGDMSLPLLNAALLPLVAAAGIEHRPRFRLDDWRQGPAMPLRPLAAVVRAPARRS